MGRGRRDHMQTSASASQLALVYPTIHYLRVCGSVLGVWVCVFSCERASVCETANAPSHVCVLTVSLSICCSTQNTYKQHLNWANVLNGNTNQLVRATFCHVVLFVKC